MKNNWVITPRNYDNVIDQILANRGIKPKDKLKFISPDFDKDFDDPALLPDYEIFIGRLKEAVLKEEKVGIFADYDADGIPGAAFLHKTLQAIGICCETYIPSREEGYGLSVDGLNSLVDRGCSLIITVDLGIKSFSEALHCKKIGVDLIITDHHLPETQLPEALAVINPKIPGSRCHFKELSGAGVVYKLACGLSRHFAQIDEGFLKWNLDLIAISTISDVVPLIGDNRLISKYGLLVLRKTRNLGLLALYDIAKISSSNIGAYEVGYMIGPRLNAPGRLGEARKSFELLTTSDVATAQKIARELNQENELRQELMQSLQEDADELISKGKLDRNKIIVIKGKWQRGIIGPTASRIADKYSRPTIVISEEEGVLTGSARSVNSINISDLLGECSQHLTKFGGHKGAAGISLRKEDFSDFYNKIVAIANDRISDKELQKIHTVDCEVSFSELTLKLSEDLAQLGPFGMGNPKPVLMTKLARIREQKLVGASKKHLSSFLEHANKRIKSIYFNYPYDKKDLPDDSEVDILYTIDTDIWNGKRYLKMQIIDIGKP